MKTYSNNKKKYTRRTRRRVRWYVPVLGFALVIILGSQLLGLYTRLSDYRQKEAALEKQLEDALADQQALQEYEAYTLSDEFIRNTARNKLGMINENEIIFKEQ